MIAYPFIMWTLLSSFPFLFCLFQELFVFWDKASCGLFCAAELTLNFEFFHQHLSEGHTGVLPHLVHAVFGLQLVTCCTNAPPTEFYPPALLFFVPSFFSFSPFFFWRLCCPKFPSSSSLPTSASQVAGTVGSRDWQPYLVLILQIFPGPRDCILHPQPIEKQNPPPSLWHWFLTGFIFTPSPLGPLDFWDARVKMGSPCVMESLPSNTQLLMGFQRAPPFPRPAMRKGWALVSDISEGG